MDQLLAALDMQSAKDFSRLVQQVSELERMRKIRFADGGTIALAEKKKDKRKAPTLTGLFHANKAGFGFVTIEGEEEDLFIGKSNVNHAIDGDTVEVAILDVADRMSGRSAEAKVIDILEHSLKSAVGQLIFDQDRPKYAGYIRSKNQKISQPIYVKKTALNLDGTEVVKVAIDKYPTRHHDFFVATLEDVVGHIDDPGIDVLQVLESLDIVSEFPQKVLDEAEAIPDKPTPKDMEGRLDLRDQITFTIDGADAKDLDDAVHIKRLKNGNLELGVHIADVSYYVTEGSELDKEALKRATSVYVTDRVVPMLPERLSNGICSLNPQVDRLTQSCIMEIDRKGRVVKHQIAQSVIKTTYRMTYSDVNEMIKGNPQVIQTYKKILPSVEAMVQLHETLESMRYKRGALNFDTNEAKILVNDKGRPVDIVLRQRGVAERMIESFMLVANETVAQHYTEKEMPFIYRIHEDPKAEKVQKFIDYASSFGIRVAGTANAMDQGALQDIMNAVKGEPYEDVLSMMLLRSMQQARYSEHNHGHYGLAAEFYTHFTSPIRRYPDLLVHRMIREYGKNPGASSHFEAVIPEIATQSSTMERRAIDAEREVEAMKKAEFMEEHVGQEFDGVVSSVVKFGLFVELPNTVEGLIHVTTLNGYFSFNERDLTLRGDRSGLTFRVGQPIRIKLVRADKATGEIDFEYVPSELDVIEKNNKKSRDSKRGSKGHSKAGSKGSAKGSSKGASKGSSRGKARKDSHGKGKDYRGDKAKKKQKKKSNFKSFVKGKSKKKKAH